MAYLLWSKFATWRKNPAQMPDGEGREKEAIALIEKGGAYFPRDATYWLDAVHTTFPLAKHYWKDHFLKIIGWCRVADRYGNRVQKIRARLDIGHSYQQLERVSDALAAYRSVLEIDPTNRVALREIDELEKVGEHH
jgi:tetratricopeptide (TPR) repeat protein